MSTGEPRPGMPVRLLNFTLQALFNMLVTNLPSHHLRLWWLRLMGVRLGSRVMVFRGVTVLGARYLVLGDRVNVGFRVVLDARGGITLGDDTLVSSDSQIVTASHNPHGEHFERRVASVTVGRNAWIATRALVLAGVQMGDGAVAAAGSVVTHSIPALTIAAGIPAAVIGHRSSNLSYRLEGPRPPLY